MPNDSDAAPAASREKDLYDVTGNHLIRLFRCCRPEYCDLLMHGYESMFPWRKFRWIDSMAPEPEIVYEALPSHGKFKIENRLYQSLCSRLGIMAKTNTACGKKALFEEWRPSWMPVSIAWRIFNVA